MVYCLIGRTQYLVLKTIYEEVIEKGNELWMNELARRVIIRKFKLYNFSEPMIRYMVNMRSRDISAPLETVLDVLENIGVIERRHEGRMVIVRRKKNVDFGTLLSMYVDYVYNEVIEDAEGKD